MQRLFMQRQKQVSIYSQKQRKFTLYTQKATNRLRNTKPIGITKIIEMKTRINLSKTSLLLMSISLRPKPSKKTKTNINKRIVKAI